MEKIEVVTLEDNQEYGIMDTLEIDGIPYLFLQEMPFKEECEVVIRKKDPNSDIILGLDSEEEYLKTLEAYVKKSEENIDSLSQKQV